MEDLPDLLAKGQFEVRYARPDGVPSRAVKDLQKLAKRQPRAYADLMVVVQNLANGRYEQNPNTERFKQLKGMEGIFELKVHNPAYRCFCFKTGRTYWVSHCVKKPSTRGYVKEGKTCDDCRKKHK